MFNNKSGFCNDFETFSLFFPEFVAENFRNCTFRVFFELIFVVFTLSNCKMPFFLESFAFFSQFPSATVPSWHFSLEPLIIFF